MVTRARFERAFPPLLSVRVDAEKLLLAAPSSVAAPPQLLSEAGALHRMLCSARLKMVTRARFERATPSFGGWCSIQLSYRATIGEGIAEHVGRALARFAPGWKSSSSSSASWWGVLDSNQ